jgi:hypothetical protein
MFALLDLDLTDTRQHVMDRIASADCGHLPPEIAVVRFSSITSPIVRKRIERRLISMARDAAADGYCAPQDRRIRAGIRVAGDGAIEATIRHNGEHVVVLIGIDPQGWRDRPEAIELAATESMHRATAAHAAIDSDSARRIAERIRSASRLTENRRGVLEHAATVPGTPEHGERENWIRAALRAEARRLDAVREINRIAARRAALAAEPAPCECCGVRPQAIPAGDCGGGVVIWCEQCHRDGGAQ